MFPLSSPDASAPVVEVAFASLDALQARAGTAPRSRAARAALAAPARGPRGTVSRRAPPSPVPDGQRCIGRRGERRAPPPTAAGLRRVYRRLAHRARPRRGAYHARLLRCEYLRRAHRAVHRASTRVRTVKGPADEPKTKRHERRRVCARFRRTVRGEVREVSPSPARHDFDRAGLEVSRGVSDSSLCDASLASETFVQMTEREKSRVCFVPRARARRCHLRRLRPGVVGDHVVALRGTPRQP